MVTLIIPWYRSLSERHNSELLGALMTNLQAPGVTRVLLVSEVDPPALHHERLEFVSVPERPNFWRLFELVRDEGPFAVVNADCAVVDARPIAGLGVDDCLWITRWDVHHGAPLGRRYSLGGGADLFAFGTVPDRCERGEWAPGEVYCDRPLGAALVAAGYNVRNTPWAVPVLHFHAERVRQEDIDRPSSGEYTPFTVLPSFENRSPLWSEPFIDKIP